MIFFRVRWIPFWIAILVGCLVNVLGDWLIGIRLELFWGHRSPPKPLGWWGFFVILAMETAMIGGVFGEIMIKRVYGWKKAPHVSDEISEADSTSDESAKSSLKASDVSTNKNADSGV